MSGSALISACGSYRYTLGRNLNSENRAHKPCLFVLINPSSADAEVPDPTLTRCVGFAEREGCTFLTIVNLFAYRTPYISALKKAHKAGVDIVGPENAEHVGRELRRHNPALGHLIVAGWGANPIAAHGLKIQSQVSAAGALCLGTTESGAPRHPLYLRADTPLVPFSPR